MKEKQLRNQRGITLIALVVTIIVLIVLAGIAISMTIGENGIFTKAREAKKLQITAEAKEKIGAEILDAQVEAIERNEELEQAQVEDIISKYGTLQDDKDTIILNDNGYDIKLSDIYQGTITTSGSYTENKAKIELLEGQIKNLQEQLEKMTEENTKNKTEIENLNTEIETLKADVERQKELLESMSQSGDEKDKKIAELNEKVTAIEKEKNDLNSKNNELKNENSALTSKATELETLKDTLSKVTASESKILKNYTAYKDGKLITGTMANYAGKTVTASTITKNGENAEITIPKAGYYGTNSKVSIPISEINNNLGNCFALETKNITGAKGYRNSSGSASWDIKNIYSEYQKLTAENFYINGNCSQTVTQGSSSSSVSFTFSKSYNAQTGILTVSVAATNASMEWSTLNSAVVTPILLI